MIVELKYPETIIVSPGTYERFVKSLATGLPEPCSAGPMQNVQSVVFLIQPTLNDETSYFRAERRWYKVARDVADRRAISFEDADKVLAALWNEVQDEETPLDTLRRIIQERNAAQVVDVPAPDDELSRILKDPHVSEMAKTTLKRNLAQRGMAELASQMVGVLKPLSVTGDGGPVETLRRIIQERDDLRSMQGTQTKDV
jgi:hypothetical protein